MFWIRALLIKPLSGAYKSLDITVTGYHISSRSALNSKGLFCSGSSLSHGDILVPDLNLLASEMEI